MLNVGTIDPHDPDMPETFLDLDDNGYFYIKQGDDWIALPLTSLPALVELLQTIRVC